MSNKTFTVDKFLGLNLSEHGSTALKLGEAAKAENFYITDDQKLKTRPGVKVMVDRKGVVLQRLAFWQGMLGGLHCTVTVEYDKYSQRGNIWAITDIGTDHQNEVFSPASFIQAPVQVFALGDQIYVIGSQQSINPNRPLRTYTKIFTVSAQDGQVSITGKDCCYVPLHMSGRSPTGADGRTQEPLNIMIDQARIQHSADGSAVKYFLPASLNVTQIISASVDGEQVQDFSFDAAGSTVTFQTPPAKGVNNVEFLVAYQDDGIQAALEKFRRMPHCEAYNGSTDTRLFFYGDGTNICYYTGVPAFGSGLYIPVGNEIAIDSSASAITGLRRHYTRLMAFKADSAFSITYEPQTLADGSVIAGFTVRPASRDVGNDMDNQIQTVNNNPRTLCGGSLYEWRHTASFYQDERYAKRIGQQVAPLLRSTEASKIVTCDDDAQRTYYMFLNDEAGTVLVNRYELDAWTVYTGEVFKNIRFADAFHGNLLFAGDNCIYCFDPDSAFDRVSEETQLQPIISQYESGYMAFGADYLRKHSSLLWLSMLPQPSSKMAVTVKTDRSDEYMIKYAGRTLFDFAAVDFSNFAFLTSAAPRIQRVKLKIKKFVYYKLIFRVDTPGARATVLGYDQQVRFASQVK